MVPRHAILALIALIASAGCRAAGFNAGLPKAEPIAAKPSLEAAEVIERCNANAARISSLEAHPTINIGSLTGGDRAVVKGDMAVERPRNFRLLLEAPVSGRPEADLGSNAQEFWFWSHRNNREKAIYVCEYDEAGATPLAAAMQPDWIVEAMGLRAIPRDEAAGVTAKPDANGLDTVLTFRRRDAQGGTLLKETVVDSTTGRIKEHRLLSAQGSRKPVLLATATISRMQRIRPPSKPGEEPTDPIILPQTVKLVWHQQKFQMEVLLNDVKVNPRFDDDQRGFFFTEPTKPGYARRSLRDDSGLAGGPSTIRETRNVPPSSSASGGVRLGDPVPVGTEGDVRTPADPRPLDADLPPLSSRSVGPEAVIGARMPTAPEAFPASAGARLDLPPLGFER